MKQMGLFCPKSSVTTLPSQAEYQLGRRRDDMEVTLKESPVVQQTDYYPFGLQHNTSWTRASDLKNDMLYNAGSELNGQTKNYETFFRQYDPALGRFTAIDPLASSFAGVTPYNYAFNDPIALNDPNGDCPGCGGRGGSVAQELHDRNFGMRDPGNHSGANGGYGWSNGLGSGGYTGGYDPAMANASLSFEQGLKSLRNSQYGGAWGSDGTTYRFRSDEEAAIAGFSHIYRDGGYRYTEIYRQLNDFGNSIAKAHYGYTGRLPEHNLIASTAPWIFDPRIETQDGYNVYTEITDTFYKTATDYFIGEGMGIFGSFNISGGISVRKTGTQTYSFAAAAKGLAYAQTQGDLTFQGKAVLMVNGKPISSIAFSSAMTREEQLRNNTNDRQILAKNFTAIGYLSMDLPTKGKSVLINLEFSYHLNTGVGNAHSSVFTIPIYIRTLGFQRDK